MIVTENPGYYGVFENARLVSMPDGKSAFKVYFFSITGRPSPETFEWAKNPLSQEAYLKHFQECCQEGIGFVTAFPHITKVFRYFPKAEILMTVAAFRTQTWTPVNLDKGDGFMEFACLAEARIADAEYRAWAKAATVEEYLAQMACLDDSPIVVKDKLKNYWEKR